MITILINATKTNSLNDLLRSLLNNAEKREFKIVIGGEGDFQEVIDCYKDDVSIEWMREGGSSFEITHLVWSLTDEVFVLGYQWDKRLEFYKDKYPDDVVAMMPSGYKHYGAKSESEIAAVAERHPVVSSKWIELVGLGDVEMICRSLFIQHGIDRRVDLRLLDIQPRGTMSAPLAYDSADVDRKADIIAEYIKTFTQGRT